jgi:hypothetical protein
LTTEVDLISFASNTYSQFGEDGIIKEILNRISSNVSLDGWCCEFGAWDGIYLSNTARLIREEKYRGVLIEGDATRVKDLLRNYPDDRVTKICAFVALEGENNLDSILSGTKIPKNFDFLSIDIDGMDFHVLKSLEIFTPKVVCIEFNPTIPNVVDWHQPPNPKIKQGSSALAIKTMAETKGYSLISATRCNLILIRNELVEFVLKEKPDLATINPQGNNPQYIFAGYDGTILSNYESITIPWHSTFLLTNLQVIPRILRKFSGDYSKLDKLLFKILLLLRVTNKPQKIWKKITKVF